MSVPAVMPAHGPCRADAGSRGLVLGSRPAGEAAADVEQADSMNSVLGKVRPILEAFTADDNALSLAELVRRSGVAKATVHRLAQELVTWGLLEREGCDYRLGLRLFELGQRVHRQRILREAVQPYMEDLLLITRETIHFAIHDSLDVVYLDKIFPHRGLNAESRVAGRLPLYCTGTGKAIMAHSPPSLFVDVVRGGLKPLTRHTVVSPGRLRAQLDRIREEGIALESEEIRLGYASLAVPVFAGRTSGLVGALSITAPTYRMDAAGHAAALRTAALGIGRSLA
ncbi:MULTISPECIES: IclR family transcriptional regulator [unclassified Streptomyces]|uniref:IclR family transcriptional regulator n=1 Tax=unclassified Streptomyces TaxID=2593676 RepID=UPI002258CE8F|nr:MULTISPECIES: IclR family transcriptional regulator [unclassified Streptomyces]MCX5440991.1 IclR family transcriptional regulator [Streptomyces sp. NBC_00063]WSE18399.1 IclR family transcriptional regulator [Streptomyces sp. NBC_01397]WUB92702.1 IclR family transcriptional regulator [Streptomyces sp. NBC_00569]